MTGAAQRPGFTTVRLLGRGNSASVYLAHDGGGRKVALKLPFAETLADPARAERFANEVRLSLRLRHEQLVSGREGTPFGAGSFLAMRYFPEGTLMRWLELGKLGLPEGLRILADVAGGIAFLHAQGVVHQDVKSQNVYLDAGRAALGDFGAAYFVTQGGQAAGSPFYMAPEIYRGEGGSGASDVYSLGVLAYEVLAHKRPFHGHSYEELMAAHLGRYPQPLAPLAPELPRAAAHLVERALAKNPVERPAARELAETFERALGVKSDFAAPETRPTAPCQIQLGRPGTVKRDEARRDEAKRDEAKRDEEGAPAGKVQEARPGRWNPFRRRLGR